MPNCVLASVNETFQDKCTDVSKFFFKAENLVLKPNQTLSIQKIFQSFRESPRAAHSLSDSDSEGPIEFMVTNMVMVTNRVYG